MSILHKVKPTLAPVQTMTVTQAKIQGGINHVTLRVKSLQRAESFYCELLGLKRVGERNGMAFYSSGRYNHELALLEDPGISAEAIRRGGLLHIAFNVADGQALKRLYRKLSKNRYPVSGGVDHIISHAFYTRDPDGYSIEITTDRPVEEWQMDADAFKQDREIDIDSL